jgi:Type II secretion system (T2SS), protein M
MSMTDRDRKIMIALVPVLILVAYWFLLLAPKRDEASQAKDDVATQQARVDTAREQVQSAEGAKNNFDASYAQVLRLGKAIPSTVDMPSLLVQLDAAAAGTGIKFTKIATGDRVASPTPATTATPAPPAGSESGTTGTPAAAGGETAQSQPGAAAEAANNAQQTSNQNTAAAENSGVAPSDTQTSTSSGGGLPVGGGTAATGTSGAAAPPVGLETVPLELAFEGNFFNLTDFFHSIKRFVTLANGNVLVSGRLLTVEGVRWASDEAIFPHIRAEITATVYLSPKSQGVTAGATPQGPATGTPASGTTPAENTPAVAPAATATP